MNEILKIQQFPSHNFQGDTIFSQQFVSKRNNIVDGLNILFLFIIFISGLAIATCCFNFSFGSELPSTMNNTLPSTMNNTLPYMNDSTLKVEIVFQGLNFPTSMDFLGPNDILVLEKNEGTVQRVVNGTMLEDPLLRVNVSGSAERGLLGMAVSKRNDSTFVFLYYTESGEKGNINPAAKALGNRLYRYELVNNTLIKPKLLLDLPATPGPAHNGGRVVIGPDDNVYLVIGDINSVHTHTGATMTQNMRDGLPPDGRGGILRVTQDGNVVPNGGILGDKLPLSLYYAYGIRNSFGIAFDPITKKLWDAENGPSFGDEINLVEPGFNSGWGQVQGIWKPNHDNEGNITLHPDGLVDFGGKGRYALPKFIWNQTVGPTALTFINSDKLGPKYKNEILVGDFNQGRIFHLHLNKSRTGFDLDNPLADNIANRNSELKGIILGQGFGGITDLKVGPDGNLYVLSLYPSNNSKWYSADCDRKKLNNRPQNCISFSGTSVEGTIFRIGEKDGE
jgi:aldose sugar dehydrogenase